MPVISAQRHTVTSAGSMTMAARAALSVCMSGLFLAVKKKWVRCARQTAADAHLIKYT